MEDIHFRTTETLVSQMDERAEALGFPSRAEYLRYVVRNDLQHGMRDDEA